jgi:hypothetical protein
MAALPPLATVAPLSMVVPAVSAMSWPARSWALSNAAAPLPVLICKVPVFAWKVALAAVAWVPLTMTLP